MKIGEQTFQILRMLLETQGELVTREELRAKLWAGDTFVDFDHGLNSAVQRLRGCLSDSAEKPRWVETVPRRGYRFIGQVDWSGEGPPSEMLPMPRNGSRDEMSDEARGRANGIRRRFTLLVGVALVLFLAAIPVVRRIHQTRFANRDTIVLADFANTTGDAVFDDTLNTALSVSLQQSPYLNVLPDSETPYERTLLLK